MSLTTKPSELFHPLALFDPATRFSELRRALDHKVILERYFGKLGVDADELDVDEEGNFEPKSVAAVVAMAAAGGEGYPAPTVYLIDPLDDVNARECELRRYPSIVDGQCAQFMAGRFILRVSSDRIAEDAPAILFFFDPARFQRLEQNGIRPTRKQQKADARLNTLLYLLSDEVVRENSLAALILSRTPSLLTRSGEAGTLTFTDDHVPPGNYAIPGDHVLAICFDNGSWRSENLQ